MNWVCIYFIRLQPPVVFYQPNYGESDAISGGQDIQIGNTMESEYADIEDTIKVEECFVWKIRNPIISQPNLMNTIISVLYIKSD